MDELLPDPTAFFNKDAKHIRHNALFEKFITTENCLSLNGKKFTERGGNHNALAELEKIIKRIAEQGFNYQGKRCVTFYGADNCFLIKVDPIFHPPDPLITKAVGKISIRTLKRKITICPTKIRKLLSETHPEANITKAESENIALILLGLNSKEIAQERNLKQNTVDRVMSTVYNRLNINGRHELIELVQWLMPAN
ncbi:MAG: LuxR C-terminal-related transcriptional regulator [Gammaproteobacteria bacterium]